MIVTRPRRPNRKLAKDYKWLNTSVMQQKLYVQYGDYYQTPKPQCPLHGTLDAKGLTVIRCFVCALAACVRASNMQGLNIQS